MDVRVLITRPSSDAERTAAKLRMRGIEVMFAPLLRIEYVAADLGGPCGALAVTSANALAAIAQHQRRTELLALPLYVVGRRTAEAARLAGFRAVVSADGDQGDLARLIRERHRDATPLLYLAGEDRAGDLAGELTATGLQVRSAVVYRAAKADGFPAEVIAAFGTGGLDGVLHFSRRSAEVYVECARRAGVLGPAVTLVHYCLSRQVSEPLAAAGAGAAQIQIAARPEEAALLDLLAWPL